MPGLLVIFLDGVGIGEKDPVKNPFFKHNFKFINNIFGETPHLQNQSLNKNGHYLFPVDPIMGVNGIPQSGTGQTSLLCGLNASELLGQHFGPFPHSKLLPVIERENIFSQLRDKQKRVKFANAYPKRFFDYLQSGHKRVGTFATSVMSAGIKLNGVDEVNNAQALSAEITNRVWNDKLGYNLKVITPAEAARRLLSISKENDFTLYEYFLTDHLGHGRNSEDYSEIITNIDNFLLTVLNELPDDLTLIICSDHGNFEDLSIKQHTFNPTLTITAGKHAGRLASGINKLYHLKPSIMEILCE
ncbi:MAG: metalloenzyme [Ignavibacteriae bacterium HGW-Ignavibacteriae-2]|jgi:hypothetical protein|nr:alkaline phosphatase family protein [Bacteroidota bacterium]PKL87254.1 MAG: metalloenzyme [Ignavibacteriae bacterium HGW-Ignavibacteriae-2]